MAWNRSIALGRAKSGDYQGHDGDSDLNQPTEIRIDISMEIFFR